LTNYGITKKISSVNSATINRFFSLHFALPFILAALVAGHLLYLHVNGSSNPVSTTGNGDRIPFHPYFSFKDTVTVFLFFVLFCSIVFYTPDKLGRRMAILVFIKQDIYNTICLENLTRIFNYNIYLIKIKLLLYIILTFCFYIYELISRKIFSLI